MPKFTRAEIRNILGEAHTDEIENRLIAAHLAVVDPLKDDLQRYKADAEKLPGIQKELDDLKAASTDNEWETKYNDEHAAFEKYKADVAAATEIEMIKVEHRKLLQEMGISEKRFDAIQRLTDFSTMKRGADGRLEDADKIKESIKSDWADYIPETHEDGADVGNPPNNSSTPFDKMNLTEKMAYANQHPNAPEVMNWLKK